MPVTMSVYPAYENAKFEPFFFMPATCAVLAFRVAAIAIAKADVLSKSYDQIRGNAINR